MSSEAAPYLNSASSVTAEDSPTAIDAIENGSVLTEYYAFVAQNANVLVESPHSPGLKAPLGMLVNMCPVPVTEENAPLFLAEAQGAVAQAPIETESEQEKEEEQEEQKDEIEQTEKIQKKDKRVEEPKPKEQVVSKKDLSEAMRPIKPTRPEQSTSQSEPQEIQLSMAEAKAAVSSKIESFSLREIMQPPKIPLEQSSGVAKILERPRADSRPRTLAPKASILESESKPQHEAPEHKLVVAQKAERAVEIDSENPAETFVIPDNSYSRPLVANERNHQESIELISDEVSKKTSEQPPEPIIDTLAEIDDEISAEFLLPQEEADQEFVHEEEKEPQLSLVIEEDMIEDFENADEMLPDDSTNTYIEQAVELITDTELMANAGPTTEIEKTQNLPELALLIEGVEQVIIQVTERIEELEDGQAEAMEAASEILDEIMDIIEEAREDTRNDSGLLMVEQAEAEEQQIETEGKLKELFGQLFDALGIEYTPELVADCTRVVLNGGLQEEILQKEWKEEEEVFIHQGQGTHEVLIQLRATISSVMNSLLYTYEIGKAALALANSSKKIYTASISVN